MIQRRKIVLGKWVPNAFPGKRRHLTAFNASACMLVCEFASIIGSIEQIPEL